jgi:hypothetical protein
MVFGRTRYATLCQGGTPNAELTLFIQGVVVKGMRLVCTLSANLSALAGALQITTGPRGKRFYRVDYDVCVYFGGTQLRATLQWKENVSTRNSPPVLVNKIAGVPS